MKERIENELVRIAKEREAFLTQANQQLAAYDGAILAYKKLLEPEPTMASEPNNE